MMNKKKKFTITYCKNLISMLWNLQLVSLRFVSFTENIFFLNSWFLRRIEVIFSKQLHRLFYCKKPTMSRCKTNIVQIIFYSSNF